MTTRRRNMHADVIVKALQARDAHADRWKGTPYRQPAVDNVAVLFEDTDTEAAFCRYAVGLGWQQFNVSNDTVRGHLHAEDYAVRFRFLRDPDDPGFRVETMLLMGGGSALHSELLRIHGPGAVAHASYKPVSGTELAQYQNENTFLMDGYLGPLQLMECFDAEYGRYTYWDDPINPAVISGYGYLKVRLNLRDVGNA